MKVVDMGEIKCKIQFCWVKAHAGIQGNEITDTLAKEAATNADIIDCYKKVPKSVVLNELGVEKWQREWDQTTMGAITKIYLPAVAERLKMKINITHNFTTVVTGHGKIRSYQHRFKIIGTPICPCSTTAQTIEYLLFECELLNKERDNAISTVIKIICQ
jgi:hypothetical protein